MSEGMKRHHKYHAEASVFSGTLELPFSQKVTPQAYVSLPEEGGYFSQRTCEFRVENAVSYKAAYTQVSGNMDTKPGHGWATLVTSVVEGLNILDVLTADRIVAQIGTEFPLDGYVPSVTFIGTRYDNLRICGEPVTVELDINMLGQKPPNDVHYNADPGFIGRVCAQYEQLRSHSDAPEEIATRYNRLPTVQENRESVKCSLVKSAGGKIPGRICGHWIDVPNFGKVELATVSVVQSCFDTPTKAPRQTLIELNMLDLQMGCIGSGKGSFGSGKTNGQTYP